MPLNDQRAVADEQVLEGYCPPHLPVAELVDGFNPAPAPDPLVVLRVAVKRFLDGMVSRVGNKAVFDFDDVLLLKEAL